MAQVGAGDLVHRGLVETVDVMPAYIVRIAQGLLPEWNDIVGAMSIGWDAGNGAAGPAIERLTQLLPGHHHLLFTQVDGHFPTIILIQPMRPISQIARAGRGQTARFRSGL
jgi:phosphomannomutase